MSVLSWLRSLLRRGDGETKAADVVSAAPVIRPNQIVPRGFHYLRATAVLDLKQFQRPEETSWDSSMFHPDDQPPPLILFISHRWESHDDADPGRRQLRAIQSLLTSIREVAASRSAAPAERVRRLPSIRIHGLFQAALILGASDSSNDEDNVWRNWEPVIKSAGDVDVLQHIGIWYDYACMPDGDGTTNGNEDGLAQILSQLPDLVRACPIVILRSKGDRYSERGWCAAEVAAARRDRNIIVLRMDLLGRPIHPSELSPRADDDRAVAEFGIRFVNSALDDWESKEVTAPHLRGLFIGLPDLKPAEESRPEPLLTTGRNPDAFPQQKALLLYFIHALRALSVLDARDGELRQSFDLGGAVREAMQRVHLLCTLERDVVFVGLSILRSRHHPNLVPTVERFYRDATNRCLSGESIKVIRFRERRPDPLKWELWYLFEGEKTTARPKPHWVR
jgi:hypothetical protein